MEHGTGRKRIQRVYGRYFKQGERNVLGENSMAENINIDVQAGSRTYNRLDMQVSQALHMAIELFENTDFLLVMDYYDDISIFDDSDTPNTVSYYQMKTNEDSISINTIIREEWLPKLYKHLNNSKYMIDSLGLITNCPVKIDRRSFTAEKTPFLKFNDETIKNIKNDISLKMNIAKDDVDLSKFVHLRTTLTIAKHRDIVEQELTNFVKPLYPKITVDSVKTIFQSIVEILTARQKYELLGNDSDFPTVRSKKGVSKDDINRVIEMTMLISIPEFACIEKMADYKEDEKYKASYEYTKILNDSQNKGDGFYSLLKKLQHTISENPILETENYVDYANRIIKLVPKNPIYNDYYKQILVISILYNTWKGN